MAILKPVKGEILAVKFIPNVSPSLAEKLNLREDQNSIGMFTTTIDDLGYIGLDEATKKASVEVVFAESMYGGYANANSPLIGEFLGILAGSNPAEVNAGMETVIDFIENEAYFLTGDEEENNFFLNWVISRTGSYLSKLAGVEQGQPLGYLVGAPIESTYALDAALKAADVELAYWFRPPSPTNYAGGLVKGSQSACKAAADAFLNAMLEVNRTPREV